MPKGMTREMHEREKAMAEQEAKLNGSEGKVSIDRGDFKKMLDRMNELESRVEVAEKKASKVALETTFERFNKTPPVMVDKKAEVIVVEEPAIQGEVDMKINECPYCEAQKKKNGTNEKNVLDPHPSSGKHACRRCGKYWLPWAFEEGLHGRKREYSLDLERGNLERVEEKERIILAQEQHIAVQR